MRLFEILDISVPFYLAQSHTKIASWIFIHKIVNKANIDLWCLRSQLKLIYCCLSRWGKRQVPSFQPSKYSCFSWRTRCPQIRSAAQYSCLWVQLPTVPPHILCKELQLKSTKIEQIASNETCGDDSYTEEDASKSKITKSMAGKKQTHSTSWQIGQRLEFELFVLSLFCHFSLGLTHSLMGRHFLFKQIQLFKYTLYFKPNSRIAHLLTKGQHSVNVLLIAYPPK